MALSRVKSLEGLYLTSFQPEQIKINRKVRDFYRKLDEYTKIRGNSRRELSEQNYMSAAALRKMMTPVKETKKETKKEICIPTTTLQNKSIQHKSMQNKSMQNKSIQHYFKSKSAI